MNRSERSNTRRRSGEVALASASVLWRLLKRRVANEQFHAWPAPYFNATRERSYDIQEGLGVKIAGETKLGPFPHWVIPSGTPGKTYHILSEPVSDWYVEGEWWKKRKTAAIVAAHTVAGTSAPKTVINITGSQDTNTAVEVLAPGNGGFDDLDVRTDGSTATWRWSGSAIKVLVGTAVHQVTVEGYPKPKAVEESYVLTASDPTVPAPGLLAKATSPRPNPTWTLSQVSPVNPAITLDAHSGSFTCSTTPGTYEFQYKINDGVKDSAPAKVTVYVAPSTPLFVDDFSRDVLDENPLEGWTVPAFPGQADWGVANGVLKGAAIWAFNGGGTGIRYHAPGLSPAWGHYYSVEARIRFQPGALGGGIAGQVSESSPGARYAAYLLPANSPASRGPDFTKAEIQLRYMADWNDSGYAGFVTVQVPQDWEWHTLRLSFESVSGQPSETVISVWYDGAMVLQSDEVPITTSDLHPNAGISIETFNGYYEHNPNPNPESGPYGPGFNMLVDSIIVSP